MPNFQYPKGYSRDHLPHIWLMTDERMGARLLPSIRALPRGSGIIFRHYSLPQPERRNLFQAVRRAARRRGVIVILAGSDRQARAWGADGYHGRQQYRGSGGRNLLRSVPMHNWREIRDFGKSVDLIFLSPLYNTASHPDGHALGPHSFARLVRICNAPIIALGGMTRARFAMIRGGRVHGWAAISGLQKK